MRTITVKLTDPSSLDRLTHGSWASLVWLQDNEDGSYSLHAAGVAEPGNVVGEAFLRLLVDKTFERDPASAEGLPGAYHEEPSAEVQNWIDRLRIRLGWTGNGQETD